MVVNGDIANISGNGGSLSGYGRPNLVGNPNGSCPDAAAGSEKCFFNPAAFATPTGSFGNFGKDILRNEPFYGRIFPW